MNAMAEVPSPQGSAPPRRPPAIRTMRSDVSEFLKSGRPSLVSLLTRELASEAGRFPGRRRPRAALRLLAAAVALAAVLAAGLFALLGRSRAPPPTSAPEAALPPPAIFYEATSEVTIGNGAELPRRLSEAGQSAQPVGSFRRLSIRLGSAAARRPPALAEFLLFIGARSLAESDLGGAAEGPPQFFVYRGQSGPRFGLIVGVRSPARPLAALFSAEPSLVTELTPLFLAGPPPATLGGYEDRTYRNLDYRYLPLDPAQDLGLGYLYFPANRRIIIATSEETVRLTVNRLLEDR